ncbi:MAG: ImmA/IrrE family metallo-endopeptidase [Rhizobiales bacterium]|nr:ImmA/IrrE family metallo-endopeptidase [Hyphomicrobiales bacterium]
MLTGDWFATPRSKKEIAAVANAWLDYFDYWHHYVSNLPGILEHDLPLLVPKFILMVREDSEMGDVLATTSFDPPQIVFRCSTYRELIRGDGRARFTAAHELGHLLLHSTDKELHRAAQPNYGRIDNRSLSAEWQADTFASNFLMPEHIARTFSSPDELAQNCQVSLAAAQHRMTELGTWPKAKLIPDLSFLNKYR